MGIIFDETFKRPKEMGIIKWFVNIVAPNNDMLEHLQKLFAQFPMVDIHALGFPKTDWQEEPLWASIQSARA